ncbi:tyrosine--tRNA ligase [Candidatus Curtissbacteria bacterium RIFCSPLOWO2_01_FULL_39_62]|uniref:Tyrosine--tRNA ligase n=2 Tax=Candidatus Curtissiibacteriota TaxID=1752717 RepID=A0A1F5G6G8_9BACT|nr:MAG: tyrosine--tRNA ligase [Candidatus Curtissbacteria bacterium RIFCSPHIGHO2_01_FULL_39_57]OGD87438.1 MAG: tyrosine--tRNA ligase [Candidatus Curtissbacteria bacterium RIFCSPHIGHO2_02_FULL_40_16b]OGD90718.1 MAG: tyrosine--tRNA ligase [Candidatus Curtissbacteria bacterium RIFCSPHIGHO2_12_FULL_38_37]OGE00685.1 MAG: tyrosine--tRNA ligase [Candidatus Curtissbacteria bacterium RIFCSPLOWO2_02_FULL_40_11]OGE01014.1 MAG: tyrosine--tRNA ligase [Candidatus Curtissbacteria bacterium RIFCSPLOWO2_01_FULL
MNKIDQILNRSVKQILPNKEGLEKLMDSKKIRVYLGVDPTGPKLHLGHSIPLKKLQEFADLGHEAILLFGTGTVLAGDPSQRNEARKKIAGTEIDENIKTWKSQAEKIINFDKVKIKYNGDWLLKLNYADIINIASNISSTQLYKREMFQERTKRGQTVWTHETLYPLFQGYDSVAMDVDLEIGGTDQTFNMLIGRELQKKMNKREKFVLITPLISGTDGKPMSKSSGNCIWLDDSASEMFGKIMSMADIQIEEYWQMLTDLPISKLKGLKPLDAKKMLAYEIVELYKGETSAKKTQKEFEAVYQKGAKPRDIDVNVQENVSLTEAISAFMPSKSQAKRLIGQGAVEIDGQIVKDGSVKTQKGQVLKIGKKTYAKVGK